MKPNKSLYGVTVWCERIIIGLFLAVILIPGPAMLLNKPECPQNEQSKKPNAADMPQILVEYYQFKNHFEKSFGFRMLLVQAHARVETDIFNVSPCSRVEFGKNGWLFYADEGEIVCSRHAQLSRKDLEHWGRILEKRMQYARQKGIRYLFIIAPDKHTIYQEQLPYIMRPVMPNSAMDQLISYLNKNTNIDVIDTRPSLLQNKDSHRLYYLTDTHWNSVGAFIAYQDITERINQWYPEVAAMSLSDLSMKKRDFGGDLADFTGSDSKYLERAQIYTVKDQKAQFMVEDKKRIEDPRIRIDRLYSRNDKGEICKLLMFRDSFATALIPYIAEHFKSGMYLWKQFDYKEVDKEQPDIIIDEIVERSLLKSPPKQ